MQAWAWSQRVLVCDRAVFVEWRKRPVASWWPARRLVPFDLTLPAAINLGHVVRTAQALDAAWRALPPGVTLCISVVVDARVCRAVAVAIVGAWRLLCHQVSAAEAHAPFAHVHVLPAPLHARDWLAGLEKAVAVGLLAAFDADEYDRCASVALTWTTKKLTVLPGPSPTALSLRPYVQYFQQHNTTVVIALERPCYDDADGVEYVDMTAEGESWDSLFARFWDALESSHGTVAVHCSTGLHRAPTCVGGYLMRAHGFSARQAVAWLRLVRPGSAPVVHALEAWERVWSGQSASEAETALQVHIGSMTLGTSLFAKDGRTKKTRRDSCSAKPLTPTAKCDAIDMIARPIFRVGSTPNRERARLRV
ncbi:dual specificity protein phosphatase [Achlya hypogyna]|uniref:Dual specificity protein phosphatase n=1 Tax=Achlya hypogyna TaxID=1202772 RepID=A0A1V9YR74_ACHHY|nr:dual specificity protein phosphatase [Achlya hypogyna]